MLKQKCEKLQFQLYIQTSKIKWNFKLHCRNMVFNFVMQAFYIFAGNLCHESIIRETSWATGFNYFFERITFIIYLVALLFHHNHRTQLWFIHWIRWRPESTSVYLGSEQQNQMKTLNDGSKVEVIMLYILTTCIRLQVGFHWLLRHFLLFVPAVGTSAIKSYYVPSFCYFSPKQVSALAQLVFHLWCIFLDQTSLVRFDFCFLLFHLHH